MYVLGLSIVLCVTLVTAILQPDASYPQVSSEPTVYQNESQPLPKMSSSQWIVLMLILVSVFGNIYQYSRSVLFLIFIIL